MKKELKEKILEEFNQNEKEYNELFYQIQEHEIALETLLKSREVQTYLYIAKNLEKAKQELKEKTDDISVFASRREYQMSNDEPYVWIYDYYEEDNIQVHTHRKDKKGTHRVYLGMESLVPRDLTREGATAFERTYDVIVLNEYNNKECQGLTPEAFNNLRKQYFKDQLTDQKVMTK